MIGGLASVILVVEVKLQIHWRRRLWQLIILMFIISIPWTWYELLKVTRILNLNPFVTNTLVIRRLLYIKERCFKARKKDV